MSNTQQNGIERIKRDINLLQDKFKKSKKMYEREQFGKEIKLLRYELMKNEMQNEKEQIRRKINLLQDRLEKKEKNRSRLKQAKKYG